MDDTVALPGWDARSMVAERSAARRQGTRAEQPTPRVQAPSDGEWTVVGRQGKGKHVVKTLPHDALADACCKPAGAAHRPLQVSALPASTKTSRRPPGRDNTRHGCVVRTGGFACAACCIAPQR